MKAILIQHLLDDVLLRQNDRAFSFAFIICPSEAILQKERTSQSILKLVVLVHDNLEKALQRLHTKLGGEKHVI